MLRKAILSLTLWGALIGCTSIMTYIKTDNRAHNSGCNTASDEGDGVKIGTSCEIKAEK